MTRAQEIKSEIERLIPMAESGEQWAEICRLEAEMDGGPFYCACGNEIVSESEQRDGVCRDCL